MRRLCYVRNLLLEIREAAQLGIFFALTLLINFYYFGTNPVAMRVCLRKVRIHNATFGAIAVSGNDRDNAPFRIVGILLNDICFCRYARIVSGDPCQLIGRIIGVFVNAIILVAKACDASLCVALMVAVVPIERMIAHVDEPTCSVER